MAEFSFTCLNTPTQCGVKRTNTERNEKKQEISKETITPITILQLMQKYGLGVLGKLPLKNKTVIKTLKKHEELKK